MPQFIGFDPDGFSLGATVTSKVSLYGVTQITQRAGAAQATSLLSTASSSAIDTQTKAALIEVMSALAAIGVWKGAA